MASADDDGTDEETDFVIDHRMSRGEVSRLLKVTPRTVGRWVSEGILSRDAEGYYDREEVLTLKDRAKKLPEPPDISDDYYGELTKGLELANSHAERLIALLEKPLKVAVDGLLAMNADLTTRLRERDSAYLDMMKVAGDMMLQKDEREAMANREAVKTALMHQAGENVLSLLPILLGQLAGGKRAGAAADFVTSLTDQQKAQMANMGAMFQGEQRTKFETLLTSLGIQAAQPAEAN